MPNTYINGSVYSTVYLGSPADPSPLVIQTFGVVAPQPGSGATGAGVYSYLSGVSLTNYGSITGGTAVGGAVGSGNASGAGVYLKFAANLVNEKIGSITGGAGAPGDTGGAGVYSFQGSVSNYGLITGGAGGSLDAGESGGAGGVGVVLSSSGATALNQGSIVGGAGGPGADGGTGLGLYDGNALYNGVKGGTSGSITGGAGGAGGYGGVGAFLLNGNLDHNYGSITGGIGGTGAAGGVALKLYGAQLSNYGSVTGGVGGAARSGGSAGTGGVGVDLNAGASLYQHGTVAGGAGGADGAAGGVGVSLIGGTVVNAAVDGIGGTISGGAGGQGNAGGTGGAAGAGGWGAYVGSGGTLYNEQSIAGGQGGGIRSSGDVSGTAVGGGGGTGVYLASGGILANVQGQLSGTSTTLHANTVGGAGGYGTDTGGSGGTGLELAANAAMSNTSAIVGGAGGTGLASGQGGAGVYLASGATLTNDPAGVPSLDNTVLSSLAGSITGGAGGSASIDGSGGAGGAGLSMNGAAFTNIGVVTGGAGGAGNANSVLSSGSPAQFSSGAGGVGLGANGASSLTNIGRIVGGAGGQGHAAPSGYNPGPGRIAEGVLAGDGGTGVYLGASTTNFNNEFGTVVGGAGGLYSNGPANSFGAAGGAGLVFSAATVSNEGAIDGGLGSSGGVGVSMGGGSLANSGQIAGAQGSSGNSGVGVALTGGTLTNSSTGHVQGGDGAAVSGAAGLDGAAGISLSLGASTANSGTISGGAGGGAAPGYSGGLGGDGAVLHGGTLSNTGAVAGTAQILGGAGGGSERFGGIGGAGVYAGGGSVSNGAGQVIKGGLGGYGQDAGGSAGAGVYLNGATLTNAGTISGGQGGSAGAIPFISGGGAGGAGVVLRGATLSTSGTISGGAGGATMAYGGTSGASGAAVQFTNGADSLKPVGSTLVVDPGAVFNGVIRGFGSLDTVDITGLAPSVVQGDFNPITDTLSTGSEGTLQFTGDSADTFLFQSDGSGGTDVTVACYRRGTRILSEKGEVAIEWLRIGDRVMTISGEMRPIRWIGQRSYSGSAAQGNPDVLPVLIRKDALSDGVPRRDLWVSPEHAMFLDGQLVPARSLVNGVSIVQERAVQEVAYIHLELDSHDVLVAEGAHSESYIDDESREQFDNAGEYALLYPQAVREAPRFCAPRIEEGQALESLRQRLMERTQGTAAPAAVVEPGPWRGNLEVVEREHIAGWALDAAQPARPLLLRVWDNGVPLGEVVADAYRQDLHVAGIGDGCHAFALDVPGGLDPAIRHLIEVQRADDGRPLRGSPRVLEASAGGSITRSALPASWRGQLETATRERLEGWAWDERTPTRPLALVILDNGEVIGRVLANRYRKDLAQAQIGAGRHGFSLHISGGLSPLAPHVIQVLGEADGCEMPSSPVLLPAAAGLDPALEHALASALAGLSTSDERDRALAFLAAQTERLLQQSAEAQAGREARLVHRQLARRWGKDAGAAKGSIATSPAPTSGASGPSAPRPRALIIDDWLPAPDKDAGSMAVLSHARALKTLGFDVSLVAAEELQASAQVNAALESEGIECCRLPYYASVEEVLRRQRDCFELVYLHRVSNAAKYLNLARQYAGRARIVYSIADLHHVRLERQAKVQGRADLLAQSQRLRAAECVAAASADAVITHSAVEAAWLRKVVRGVNVHVVPWAVPVRAAARPWSERHGIAFIANFAFAPNVDAAHYFVEEIMPLVWQQDPSIECLLVGSRMPKELAQFAGPKVDVLGHVADLGTVFNRVRLTVAPLRFGAGVKGKVLESLAAGVPCIMTPVAAEGIELPAASAWVGANAQELAARILEAYAGGERTLAAVEAGLALVREQNSPEAVVASLQAVIEGRRVPGEVEESPRQFVANGQNPF